jgi:hypothetical protein
MRAATNVVKKFIAFAESQLKELTLFAGAGV